MNKLKTFATKKITSLVLSIVMVFSAFALPAFAEEPAQLEETSVSQLSDTPVTRQSVGSLLTSCGGSISGGYGELTCYLGNGNWWSDIMAGVSSSSSSGIVSCYVTEPDGTETYLGAVSASGGTTNYVEFTYCGAGTYTFSFESTVPDTIYVYGRIFD